MTNNEKKMLSRNIKRRINRRRKIIDDVKILLNKIKSEKKRKIKILIILNNQKFY